MKITKQQLEQIIKEEVKAVLGEGDRPSRPSVHQQFVNNLLAGHKDFEEPRKAGWSPAALAAVGKAWKLIDELANDIAAAAGAHVRHHGTDQPLKYGDTWQMAKEIGARVAAGVDKGGVDVHGTTPEPAAPGVGGDPVSEAKVLRYVPGEGWQRVPAFDDDNDNDQLYRDIEDLRDPDEPVDPLAAQIDALGPDDPGNRDAEKPDEEFPWAISGKKFRRLRDDATKRRAAQDRRRPGPKKK